MGFSWAAVTPGVARIAPVPGATPSREVFVLPRRQGRVQFFAAGRTLIADSCGGVGTLPFELGMDAMRVFRPGRTFIITP
jgi:hypothetical protein